MPLSTKEKIKNYFSSSNIDSDLKEGLKEFIIKIWAGYLEDQLQDFMQFLPNGSLWLTNRREAFKTLFLNGQIVENDFFEFMQSLFKAKCGITNSGEFKSNFKITEREHVKSRISHHFINNLKRILDSITIRPVLEVLLLKFQKDIAKRIREDQLPGVDEIEDTFMLKKYDILRNLYLVENQNIKFDNEYEAKRYALVLTNALEQLFDGKLHSWNNLYSSFEELAIQYPEKYKLHSTYVPSYNFADYQQFEYLYYCWKIINREEKISMVKFQLEREVAANMSNWEKEFYKKEMEMRPERVKQIIDFVNNDQLIKFSDHIAMTSLIAFLDPIMKAITSELIKAGRIQMQVHKYNITITYHKFRTAYLAVANPYPHIDTVEFLFEQLYSKRGYSGRNAILHLDGIDFNIPYKYSSKISLLLQNIYYYLNDLMVYENIALTELPSSFNQFDDSDVELVVKYQDATNDYFINKSVPQDILAAGDRDQIAKLSLKEMEEARERYKSLMPQFAHLHAISSFSVQVEDSNEALLTISMSAILLEKLLLNFKQSLNMPGNFASSHYSNTLYQCTFKSLELNNPGNSFVNSDLLEKLYEHITGQDHLEDPEDYDAFLSLLKTLEKIRNISAHGGVEQFRPLYREINHFLFFLSFRLV